MEIGADAIMSISDSELLDAMATLGAKLSISEIMERIEPKTPRRTLHRALTRLVQNGDLVTEGKGPATKYWVRQREESDKPIAGTYGLNNLKLTPAAQKIKQYVEMPLHNREPIGYKREFLDQYVPNKSYLLDKHTREHLHHIGDLGQGYRPAGTYARSIFNRLLIDLSWNSSRLEGNTYSLLETERLIVDNEIIQGKSAFETQMILNHKAAIEFLVEAAEDIGFNRYTILNLHALLANNLLGNAQACGKVRDIPVAVAKTVYQPLGIPQILDELFQQILDKANAIKDPFEQAFFVLVHFAYLQAFEDVNKRVARLSANIPFIKENLCPLSFVDFPEKAYIDGILGVYELNKTELLRDIFVWAYERSAARYAVIRDALGEPDIFKLTYRTQIKDVISKVVGDCLNKKAATEFVHRWALENIKKSDYLHFIEAVECELLELHEGNFARYRIRISDFNAWWKKFHR